MNHPSSAPADGSGTDVAEGAVSPAEQPQHAAQTEPAEQTEPVEQTDQTDQTGPVIRDKRRLDPATGQVRAAYAATEPAAGDIAQSVQDPVSVGEVEGAGAPGTSAELDAAWALAQERLNDLQRLQAEYVNYRRRVDRDRDVARDAAVASVLEALLPVLDDVHLARQHGDLESGPFAAIAEKLEATLSRFGLVRYGEPGETFDPNVHEALIHTQAELAEGTSETTVVQLLQPGYRAGDRILRAARVAVADPR
jgi:molecular chaperone GrpE